MFPGKALLSSFVTLIIIHCATSHAFVHRSTGADLSDGIIFKSLEQPYYPPNANCEDYMIPVDVSWDRLQFNATKWQDNDFLQNFLSDLTTREPGPNYPSPLGPAVKVNTTYQIAASFCSPKLPSEKSKTVIVATHGVAPGRSHWNSAFEPENYNFVQYATQRGYSVFFYDRLGCGASEKFVITCCPSLLR